MAKRGKSKVFTSEKERVVFGKISRKSAWIIAICIFLLFGLGAYFFIQWTANRGLQETGLSSEGVPQQSGKTSSLQTTDAPGVEGAPLFGDANYQSEHFRVGDIALGGEAEFLLTEDTPDPLVISAISGETFTEKNGSEVKLMLSWNTNKLAKSEVTYAKGARQSKRTVNEEDYSLDHSLILSGLDQASTYVYTIVSQDRFGNTATSDSYAVYTGSKTASLFDLIAGAIGEVFGWAINKK